MKNVTNKSVFRITLLFSQTFFFFFLNFLMKNMYFQISLYQMWDTIHSIHLLDSLYLKMYRCWKNVFYVRLLGQQMDVWNYNLFSVFWFLSRNSCFCLRLALRSSYLLKTLSIRRNAYKLKCNLVKTYKGRKNQQKTTSLLKDRFISRHSSARNNHLKKGLPEIHH